MLTVGEWYKLPPKRLGLDTRRPAVPVEVLSYLKAGGGYPARYVVRLDEPHRRQADGPLLWDWVWRAADFERYAQRALDGDGDAGDDRALDGDAGDAASARHRHDEAARGVILFGARFARARARAQIGTYMCICPLLSPLSSE